MLAQRLPSLIEDLRRALGGDNVLANRSDLLVYECDGFVIEKNSPDVVVFPHSTAEVAAVIAFLVSDDASYLTGQTIYPDGGRLALNYTVPVPPGA